MSFLDVFKKERTDRTIYGMAENKSLCLLTISYLLVRVPTTEVATRHKLLAKYGRCNRGKTLNLINIAVGDTGGGYFPAPGNEGFIFETYSRVISIAEEDLSGTGTTEEQIAEYISANNLVKAGDDAEVWVEIT